MAARRTCVPRLSRRFLCARTCALLPCRGRAPGRSDVHPCESVSPPAWPCRCRGRRLGPSRSLDLSRCSPTANTVPRTQGCRRGGNLRGEHLGMMRSVVPPSVARGRASAKRTQSVRRPSAPARYDAAPEARPFPPIPRRSVPIRGNPPWSVPARWTCGGPARWTCGVPARWTCGGPARWTCGGPARWTCGGSTRLCPSSCRSAVGRIGGDQCRSVVGRPDCETNRSRPKTLRTRSIRRGPRSASVPPDPPSFRAYAWESAVVRVPGRPSLPWTSICAHLRHVWTSPSSVAGLLRNEPNSSHATLWQVDTTRGRLAARTPRPRGSRRCGTNRIGAASGGLTVPVAVAFAVPPNPRRRPGLRESGAARGAIPSEGVSPTEGSLLASPSAKRTEFVRRARPADGYDEHTT
jgi:hypothetical protein